LGGNFMSASIIASAIAANALGYSGVARLIIEQQLSPSAIARLFSLSASPDAGRVAAVVILAGSGNLVERCHDRSSS